MTPVNRIQPDSAFAKVAKRRSYFVILPVVVAMALVFTAFGFFSARFGGKMFVILLMAPVPAALFAAGPYVFRARLRQRGIAHLSWPDVSYMYYYIGWKTWWMRLPDAAALEVIPGAWDDPAEMARMILLYNASKGNMTAE